MTDFEAENGVTRAELLRRVELMEAMIAEGRRKTGRFGWIFVLWGIVDLTGMAWQLEQQRNIWVWPIVIAAGMAVQFVAMAFLRRAQTSCGLSIECRSVSAVWSMMGAAIGVYMASAMVRHVTWQVSYVAAILLIVGLAHATSAVILRWKAQGVVAGLWWAGAVATYFTTGIAEFWLVALVMFFGLVVFGLYAMMLERRRGGGQVAQHA